jgi:hypothetical protein
LGTRSRVICLKAQWIDLWSLQKKIVVSNFLFDVALLVYMINLKFVYCGGFWEFQHHVLIWYELIQQCIFGVIGVWGSNHKLIFLVFKLPLLFNIEMINPRIKSFLLNISSNHATCQENTICFDYYKRCHWK